MRKIAAVVFTIVFAALLSGATQPARGLAQEQARAFGIDQVQQNLPDDAREILGEADVIGGVDLDSGLDRLIAAAGDRLTGILRQGARSASVVLAVAILCSLAGSIYENGQVPDFVPLGGVLAIAAAAIGDVRSMMGLGTELLQTLNDFSKLILPCLAAAGAATGAVTEGAARYAASALFMDILITAANGLIMPVIYAYLGAVIAGAATGGQALEGVANLIKWLSTTMMTGLVIVFTTYLSLTGVISGSSDAAATKLAKGAIGAALPVVGKIVTDAAETIVAGASMLRNSIGVLGLLTVASVCLIPFLSLGVHYLMYKLAASVSAALSDKRLAGLISGIGGAFGMVLGLTGSAAVMLFISLISSIKVVSGL